MKAEIKTTTEKVMREVEETRETVHLELSIQEAHLIERLLGGAPCGDCEKAFGIPSVYDTWYSLAKQIGSVGPSYQIMKLM